MSQWLSWRGGGTPSSRRTRWPPGTLGPGSGWSCPWPPGPGTRWASAWRATTTSGPWWVAGPGARWPGALSSPSTSSGPEAGLSWRGQSHSASATLRCWRSQGGAAVTGTSRPRSGERTAARPWRTGQHWSTQFVRFVKLKLLNSCLILVLAHCDVHYNNVLVSSPDQLCHNRTSRKCCRNNSSSINNNHDNISDEIHSDAKLEPCTILQECILAHHTYQIFDSKHFKHRKG